MLEKYADAIVADLKSKLPNDDIPVFGGSTKVRWFKLRDAGRLPLPSIVVVDSHKANAKLLSYSSRLPNGELAALPCDADHIPVEYEFCFTAFSADGDYTDSIVENIHSIYRDGTMLDVDIHGDGTTVVPLFVRTDRDSFDLSEAAIVGNRASFMGTIKANPAMTPKPICIGEEDLKRAQADKYISWELASAAFYCEMLSCPDLIENTLHDYRYLLGMESSQHGDGIDPDLTKMRKKWSSENQLDEGLFERKFQRLTRFYPNLYQATLDQEPYESVQEKVMGLCLPLQKKKDEICDALGIPESFDTNAYKSYQPRGTHGLQAYADALAKGNYDFTMDQAHEAYAQLVKKEEERKARFTARIMEDIHAQERMSQPRASYDEGYYDDGGSSSGPGFLSSVAMGAVGTAIGTRGIRKELREQTKMMRKQEREEERKAEERRRYDEKYERARQSQREFDAVRKANEERRRKGQPELPLPPRWYA